jgi:hypothetical protein
MNPVVTLLFDGWIPPAGQVDDMSSRSQRQSGAGRLQSKNKQIEALAVLLLLEPVDDLLSFLDRRITPP